VLTKEITAGNESVIMLECKVIVKLVIMVL
jgi:hypothetical protein